jgi:hypothetical protein
MAQPLDILAQKVVEALTPVLKQFQGIAEHLGGAETTI